jgi:hypothetical protein
MTTASLRTGIALCFSVLAFASFGERPLAQAGCPCTIWPPGAVPANPAVSDGQPIEIGVKFRSDVSGFVTAIRFYKGVQNTGTHVGHLWSASGTLLAEAMFTGETASGWQEVTLTPAVAVVANTTYVASYHSDSGFFAFDSGFFAASGVDTPPLHALGSGVDGPNGVFAYGPSGFPSSGGANNYWIDVVFQTDLGPDVTPPTVTAVVPANAAAGVPLSSTVRATFSEAIDPATITTATFEVRDASNTRVSGAVGYEVSSRTATFTTTAGWLPQTAYTARIHGVVEDLAGNPMASDFAWSFTTGDSTPPTDVGPGGPILVISSASNPFSRYYAEILRTEGLNAFQVADMSQVTAATLNAYDVVLLGEIPLTAAQAGMLTDYVVAGGNLVAMRPDKQLAGLLGLIDQSSTLPNAYLQVNTSSPPGAGIVSETIQFHGTADRYTADTAATIATLFSDASTATASPAVTIATAGSNGGHAAAFAFDLARSIVYTRQGNPAWSGQERDGITPIRSDDLFFGAAPGDAQADWVDLDKVAIPQADEQQRLLANLILHLNRLRTPLPRFWYLPRGLKAAIVMTGDDHANGGTVGRFNQYKALSAPGCSVADWECIRGTSYIFNGTPGMDDAAASAFVQDGFEVGLHVTSNCGNWTPASLAGFYASQIAQFQAERPSVPAIRTNRTHCIVWSDYVSQPKIALANGIRFDTNYYYFPGNWVQDRPGHFTGSAMPMRFADLDGTTIDVYQAATQMTDESGQTYPFTADTLLDRALGPEGYYGVFTTNHHTDAPTIQPSDATVASAIARNVPVVSAKQMLDWLDGRNGSSFGSIAWAPGALTFTIAATPGVNGLTAMVPTHAKGGALTGLTRDGVSVDVTAQVVKGVEYAFFAAASGSYVATYVVDVTPPVISSVAATPGVGNTAAITWTTDEPADSSVDFGTSPSSLTGHAGNGLLVTSHGVTLAGLSPSTTYYFRVTSADGAGNSTSTAVASFTMPATVFTATDTTVADFGAGATGGQTSVVQSADGEVILSPASGSEFAGAELPPDWSMTAWAPGGGVTVSGGVLAVDGARAGTITTYAAGRSVEFVATFSGAPFQHAGFGDSYEAAPWAMFSTASGGGLFARTDSGSQSASTALSSSLLGSPHRFRIDWTPAGAIYSVDGAVVATHSFALTTAMRLLVSDLAPGGEAPLTLNWMQMGPYTSAGTFVSRVFDAGAIVNWGTLSWIAQLPAATGVTMFERRGDTPIPDATWTAFTPLAASGDPIGGSSRYFQYRADLASGDTGQTPTLEQVTIGYSEIPPNHAPVAAVDSFSAAHAPLTVAAPGVLANDTDAEEDSLISTLVSGPSHGTLTLQENGGFTYTPGPGFLGSDSFSYKANDGQADSNVAVVSLSITPAFFTAIDTTTADFSAGTLDGQVAVSETAGGEVILRPTAGAEFGGTAIPAGWTVGTWHESGTATVSGGTLAADGAWAGTTAFYPAGRSLEFIATFTGAPYQHVGFGETLEGAPWAIFSTGSGGGLFARTASATSVDTPLSSALLGSPHRFRIDWTSSSVTYSVDGIVVAVDEIAVNAALRPLVSDFAPGDGALTVDWIRMTPYAGPGTFLSRIVDAGSVVNWDALTWAAQTPSGTSVALSVRRGDVPLPDATWTAFESIAASGSGIGGSSRYLQYRVELTAGDPASTPSIDEVSIGYSGFPPTLVTATDTTSADFGAGTLDEQVVLAQSANGEVILWPAAGSEFDGSALPVDWTAGVWNPEGSAVVVGGALTADGAWTGTEATYPSGRSLEFVATFSGAPYQHAGFGEMYDAAPWAMFSTFQGGGLFVRTDAGSGGINTPLPSGLLGSPHRFRIDWAPDGVTYSVDGVVVATHPIAIAGALRPLVSDFTPGDGALAIDWIRVSPFASSGTFLSRVFDAGGIANWGTLAWAAQVPPGATVGLSVRHGDTPVPDATWTAFVPVAGSGGSISGSTRYLQYRAELATGDQASTPSLEQVSISYWVFP